MKRSTLDAWDWAIITQLSANSRLSTRRIASKLPLSEATVRRRLKRLIDADVVNLRALIDPTSLDYNIEAIVGLSVQMDRVTKVVEALRRCDNVIYLAVVSGRFDITFLGVFKSAEDLLTFMETQVGVLDGVKGTETLICLRVEKGRHAHLGAQAEKRAYPEGEIKRGRRSRKESVVVEAPGPEPKPARKPAKRGRKAAQRRS
ncbi:MAG: Lrp/AsnC family transcriptional regulator [Chloroflexi bacterium]|nr:Lrp/AsnC family transcriptional regulator [Chloroflexota bacterium]